MTSITVESTTKPSAIEATIPFAAFSQSKGVSRRLARRRLVVLLGSLMVHAIALGYFTARSFWFVEELAAPQLRVGLSFQNPALTQDAPAPVRAGRPMRKRRPSPSTPTEPLSTPEPEATVNNTTAMEADDALPVGDVAGAATGEAQGAFGGEGHALTSTVPMAAPPPPPPPPAAPLQVSSAAMARQCISCPPPSLLPHHRRPGVSAVFVARFCIDEHGQQRELALLEGIADDADTAILNVLRAWRHNPYIGTSGPTKACTRIRFVFVGR